MGNSKKIQVEIPKKCRKRKNFDEISKNFFEKLSNSAKMLENYFHQILLW